MTQFYYAKADLFKYASIIFYNFILRYFYTKCYLNNKSHNYIYTYVVFRFKITKI